MTRVVQIKIGKHPTGIVGLDEVLKEMALQNRGLPDSLIGAMMKEKLSKKNYIPSSVSHLYETAFVREYKKFIGAPVPDTPLENVVIKVLGMGCPNCDRLEKELMDIIAETGIDADLDHVRDIREIGRYGVMGSPGLIINGSVKAVGSLPPKSKLREWLLAADTEIRRGRLK